MILNGIPACHVCSARNSAKLVLDTLSPWSLMVSGCVLRYPGNDSHHAHARTHARTGKVYSLLQTLPVSVMTELIGNAPLVNFKRCFQSVVFFFVFFLLHPPVERWSSSRSFSQNVFTPMGMGVKWKRLRFHIVDFRPAFILYFCHFFTAFSHFSPLLWSPLHIVFNQLERASTHTHNHHSALFWWQYMQKAKRDEDEPQPTNCEFQPWGSLSARTIATVS